MNTDSPAKMQCDTLLLVGLGLIGASIAAALRDSGFCRRILGWDADPDSMTEAHAAGLIDTVPDSFAEAAVAADLVVIAVPTLSVEQVLAALRDADTQAVVSDVASVKASVLAAAARVFGSVPANFVPGHPIAGRERSGVAAADATLFRDHRVILTPTTNTADAARSLVESMWRHCGAELVFMDAAHHDRVLAFTSHLPHMLAYTLVSALASEDSSEEIFRFAAGGFRDFTRIASSDPVMWRDIVMANREQVLESLDHFAATLDRLRAQVEQGQDDQIHDTFAAARAARNRYLGWLASRHDE
jgi:3-phosphoshikimate 1-carboxyvinyltransferase